MRPLISIICPVYNEEDTIPTFYERLRKALEPLVEGRDWTLYVEAS
jgi:glycosyltransferase involved in cell wall biosynthesis